MTDQLRATLDEIKERAGGATQHPFSDYVHDSQADIPGMLAALEWMQEKHGIDDPCPPWTCSHADCEITNGLTERLVES